MTANRLVSTILIVSCVLLMHAGCEEQAATPQRLNPNWFQQFQVPQQQQTTQPAVARNVNQPSPSITFEKVVHDFGNMSPQTDSLCEFKFANTGDGILKISQVEKTCGCTPFSLTKTEYAPGESGSLKVQYYSDTQLGQFVKNLTVHTNDRANPSVKLAVKARVMTMVDFEPKALSLLLQHENGGCPKITLTSTDGKPFSISHFKSTAPYITADYNPSVKAMSFVLEPKIDMARLEKNLDGRIEIGLTHPECRTVTVNVRTIPRFKVSPILARGVRSGESVVKKVRVVNNYNEDFGFTSVSSKNGTATVLSTRSVGNGYELEVEISPPAKKNARFFSETLLVTTTSGEKLEIPCNVFFASAEPTPTNTSGKCKVCGPRVISSTGINARDF